MHCYQCCLSTNNSNDASNTPLPGSPNINSFVLHFTLYVITNSSNSQQLSGISWFVQTKIHIPKHVWDSQLSEELCWQCWIFLWVIKFLELNFCWHCPRLNWWLLVNEMSDSWKFRALDSYPGGHWFDSQGCKYENQKGYIVNWISSESLGKGLICVLVPNINKTNIWINPDVMIFSFCKYDSGTFVHCPQFQFF